MIISDMSVLLEYILCTSVISNIMLFIQSYDAGLCMNKVNTAKCS